MVNLSKVKLDTTAVDGGVWKSDKWGLGFRLLIASGRNRAFVSVMREAARVRDRDEAAYQRTYSEALARHILKGWEGFDGEDGKPLPYSYAQSLEFMTSPDFAHIREMVDETAGETAEYLVKSKAEAGKD